MRENRLWGAERIRGEWLKRGIKLSQRTLQRDRQRVRGPRPRSPTWTTFLRNPAPQIWACDFVQTYDRFFRARLVLVLIEHPSRQVIHDGVTRTPSEQGVAQPLKQATAFGVAPK